MNSSRVITIAEDVVKRVIDDNIVIVTVKNLGLSKYVLIDLNIIVSLEKYLELILPKNIQRMLVVLSTKRINNYSDIKIIISKVRKDTIIQFLFSEKLKENIMIIFY